MTHTFSRYFKKLNTTLNNQASTSLKLKYFNPFGHTYSMGSVQTVGDWLEKQRALSSSGHNLEGVLLAGEAARTPSKHCCCALDQCTKLLKARIGSSDWFRKCTLPSPAHSWDRLQHPPREPTREKQQSRKKINEVCVC